MAQFVKLADGRYLPVSSQINSEDPASQASYRYANPDYNPDVATADPAPQYLNADPSQIVNSVSGNILSFTPNGKYSSDAGVKQYHPDQIQNDYGDAVIIDPTTGKTSTVHGRWLDNGIMDRGDNTAYRANGSVSGEVLGGTIDPTSDVERHFGVSAPGSDSYEYISNVAKKQAEAAANGPGAGIVLGILGGMVTAGIGSAFSAGGAAAAESGSLSSLFSTPNITGNALADNALWGAGKGALTSAITGGDPLRGALTGGVSGAVTPTISGALNDAGITGTANQALTRGATGLLGAAMNGNDPLRGAAVGAISGATGAPSGLISAVLPQTSNQQVARTSTQQVAQAPTTTTGKSRMPGTIDFENWGV